MVRTYSERVSASEFQKAARSVEEIRVRHHADGAAGVCNVGGRAGARWCVGWLDLHRRMRAAGGGTSADPGGGIENPRRSISASDEHHLIKRGRDQPREADDVDLVLDRLVEDAVGRDHDAEVDHLVVVALQDDADDVLADVVHVALDGGHQHLARAPVSRAVRLGLHERQQVGDWPASSPAPTSPPAAAEHLPGSEEVADHVHAGQVRGPVRSPPAAWPRPAAPLRCPRR